MPTISKDLKTYIIYCIGLSLIFSLYPIANNIADHYLIPHRSVYSQLELSVPLIPSFILVYFSFYLLFIAPYFFVDKSNYRSLAKMLTSATIIAFVVFVFIPGNLGFSREVPSHYANLYESLFKMDKTYNLYPSLHVAYSVILGYFCGKRSSNLVKWIFAIWVFLISCSTVLVHQHHLFDVASALVLTGALIFTHKNDVFY